MSTSPTVTGPAIAPGTYTIEGNSIVFPEDVVGGVGGRPYLYGALSLTIEGRNPLTGQILVSGRVEEIHQFALVLELQHGRGDGNAARLLQLHPV